MKVKWSSQVLNIIIRFCWISYIPESGPNFMLRTFICGMLEIFRRWQWNFCESILSLYTFCVFWHRWCSQSVWRTSISVTWINIGLREKYHCLIPPSIPTIMAKTMSMIGAPLDALRSNCANIHIFYITSIAYLFRTDISFGHFIPRVIYFPRLRNIIDGLE